VSVRDVLVIDDDASVRALLEHLLSAEGYGVRTAPDGFAGLRSFAAQPPDCVVLDVMMPSMDGFEVLEQIRSRHCDKTVAVVMLTAASDDRHAWRAWQTGVDYFLGKPFEIAQLLGFLASLNRPESA
jgi:DNA-binding response OmpR family regulator